MQFEDKNMISQIGIGKQIFMKRTTFVIQAQMRKVRSLNGTGSFQMMHMDFSKRGALKA